MASFTVPCPKAGSASLARLASAAKNLPRSATQTTSLSFGFQGRKNVLSTLRKVNVASSSNSVAMPSAKPAIKEPEEKKPEAPKEITTESKNKVPDAESVSAFMAQVSDLIKLVDSRDIVELQMKQLDCEITIRKKEALEQPQVQYSAFPPQAMYSSPPPLPPPQQATASPASPAALPAPSPAKSGHPPLKSPMPGTFYRCPAPGEPPFVKVGDKVQKGQVVCIIEAMKLMNEIEADQSGTVVEIVAEDGKPVSVDTHLFVIAP